MVVVTTSMLETSPPWRIYRLNGDSDFPCESSLGTKDKLPPFKRLSHKGMQEMSLKNLPGVAGHGWVTALKLVSEPRRCDQEPMGGLTWFQQGKLMCVWMVVLICGPSHGRFQLFSGGLRSDNFGSRRTDYKTQTCWCWDVNFICGWIVKTVIPQRFFLMCPRLALRL